MTAGATENIDISRRTKTVQVTIPEGATESEWVDREGYAYGLAILPAAMDGSNVAFEISHNDGTSAKEVYRESLASPGTFDQVSWPNADILDTAVPLPDEIAAAPKFRFVSDAEETADRTFTVMLAG